MAESSLSLGYPDFQKQVGEMLGFGRDSADWSAEETSQVDEIIAAGYRQFLFPSLISGQRDAWEWTFLRPVTTIDTVADQGDYDLPDDFGSIDGDLTFGSNTQGYESIPIAGEGVIRRYRHQLGIQTARPRQAAVRPKASDQTTGQRFELLLWPTPDQVYTLSYRYVVLPNKLSALAPYPLGGMAHAETVLASCLAVAEHRFDDERGVRYERFMERLTASIAYDQRTRQEFFGYNADQSDGRDHHVRRNNWNVTYKGNLYP